MIRISLNIRRKKASLTQKSKGFMMNIFALFMLLCSTITLFSSDPLSPAGEPPRTQARGKHDTQEQTLKQRLETHVLPLFSTETLDYHQMDDVVEDKNLIPAQENLSEEDKDTIKTFISDHKLKEFALETAQKVIDNTHATLQEIFRAQAICLLTAQLVWLYSEVNDEEFTNLRNEIVKTHWDTLCRATIIGKTSSRKERNNALLALNEIHYAEKCQEYIENLADRIHNLPMEEDKKQDDKDPQDSHEKPEAQTHKAASMEEDKKQDDKDPQDAHEKPETQTHKVAPDEATAQTSWWSSYIFKLGGAALVVALLGILAGNSCPRKHKQ